MRRSITKIVLATGALALAVAGCGGDDEQGAAASSPAGIVSMASVDGTDVLADAEGRTLYRAAVEEGGKILCVDACTSFWEPLTASSAEAESAAAELDLDLGVVERPEGDRQLTLDGLPLYTFPEEDAGQLDGDGFVDDFQGTHFEWEAATTSGDGGSGAPNGGGSDPFDY